MKKLIIIAAAVSAMSVGVLAQTGVNTAEGCLQTAISMCADGNYHGALDQLSLAATLNPDAVQTQRMRYYTALAAQHTDMSLAIRLFEDYLADYPASADRNEVLFRLGNCWYGRDYATALRYYEAVYDSALDDSQYEDLCYRMAYCCLEEGSLQDADGLFKSLEFSRRYAPVAAFYRGYIAYRQGRYAQAMEFFRSADKESAPGNMTDFYLSQIYFNKGDYQKALQLAKSTLRLPDLSTVYVAEASRIAGESAYSLGDDAQAGKYLAYYMQLVEKPLPSAQYILGLYAYNSAEYRLAIGYLRPATEGTGAMGQSAYYYLGQACLKSGDTDGALMAFDKALAMDYDMDVKENAYYNYAVASVDGAMVPFGSAVTIFNDFLRLFPNSKYAPKVQEYIITSYLTDNNYEAALQSIDAMAEPSDATLAAKQRVLYVLGTKALAASDIDRARNYLEDAAKLASHDRGVAREVQLSLGEALYRDGDYAGAEKAARAYLRDANKDMANYQVAQYDLGYALFAQGRYDKGAEAFSAAVTAGGPMSGAVLADAYNRLGDCLLAGKKLDRAAETYKKAYDQYPDGGDYALLQQAVIAGYQRGYDRKVQLIDRLMERFPKSALIPDAMLEKCEAYIQLGQNADAIATYKRLVEGYPKTTQGRQGYLQMALTLLTAGKRAEAEQAYRDVIANYPTSEEAAVAVEQMKTLCAEDGTLAAFTDFVNGISGAPRIEESEVERITFETAEKEYITGAGTRRLREYLEAYPAGASRPRAMAYLIESEYAGGNTTEAYRLAGDLVEQYPQNALAANAWRVKGEIEEADGRNVLALHSWTRLAEIASTPEMLALARTGMMRTGRLAESDADVKAAADALLQTAVQGTDEYIEAVFSEGWILNRQNRAADARRQWQTVADKTDNLYGIQSAYMLGQSYFDNGDIDNAAIWAEKVAKASSPHKYWVARGFILLSDIFSAKGEDYKAKQYLESLRANYPGNEADIKLLIDQRLQKLQ